MTTKFPVLLCLLWIIGQENMLFGQGACCGSRRVRTPTANSLFDDPDWQQIRWQQWREAVVDRSTPALRNATAATDLPISQIFGGVPSTKRDFPGCVAVLREDGQVCTGTLVAPQVVVAAAHCLFDGSNRPVNAQVVYVGIDVGNRDSKNEYRVRAQEAHPEYLSHQSGNDLAVLILDRAVADVVPHPIADVATFEKHKTVTLAGYGVTSTGDVRQQYHVCVPFLRDRSERFGYKDGFEFVAGEPQHSQDACNGDTGGPAFIRQDGVDYLAGVTSRAVAAAKPHPATGLICGDGGIYVRPDRHADFIIRFATLAGVEVPRFGQTSRNE